MPTLTIKTEYVERLKQLGVYDAWLVNVKDNWDMVEDRAGMLKDCYSFHTVISWAFTWSESVEGYTFWRDISGK